ncbi:UNVERIFIED_CONTAM: hypothetical protein NCL1_24086 [Trichonephila clavipes]
MLRDFEQNSYYKKKLPEFVPERSNLLWSIICIGTEFSVFFVLEEVEPTTSYVFSNLFVIHNKDFGTNQRRI